jgi:hypothetical protein
MAQDPQLILQNSSGTTLGGVYIDANGNLVLHETTNNNEATLGTDGTVTASAVSATASITYPDGVTATTHSPGGDRGLQPEGMQTGLACGSGGTTGVKYTGEMTQTVDTELLNGASAVRLEAATNSSDGDETVTVEVYDETATAVADSVAITGGGQASKEISASLTAGNAVRVRWNVTTLSAASGATFDAVAARLVVV